MINCIHHAEVQSYLVLRFYSQILLSFNLLAQPAFSRSVDSGIVEKAGGQVKMVESSPLNFKITVATDMDMAEFVFTHCRS